MLDVAPRASHRKHMHELGIAQSALERVLEETQKAGASRVLRIVLRIGSFSGVDPESLRFAFEVVCAGTPASSAEFQIEDVPAIVHCETCEADFAPDEGPPFACPRCQSWSGTLVRGRELDLVRIEMT